MPTSKWTVLIDRKPDEVFGYLADIKRHGEWSPKPYRVEGLPEGPIKVGTKFTSYGYIPRDKDHRNDVEVKEYDPPSMLMFVSTEPGQEFVNRFVLTPENGGTKVERTLDMPKPPGVVGALFPIFKAAFLQPAIQKGMNMFKQRLESSK